MNWEKGWDQNVQFWGDVFNPMGYVELATDPSEDKFAEQALHFSIKSAIATGAAAGVWALSGGGASMGMWFGASPPTAKRMFALKADTYRAMAQFVWQAARTGISYAPQAAIIAAPIVASTAGAIAYERMVNEPLRDAHHSTQGTWFGAFASGFGSVV